MLWRKGGIAALTLVLLLALTPVAPHAEEGPIAANGAHTALKYAACAGSIVFMVLAPESVFFTTLVCINAFITKD
jgi:hypothetical protein